MINQLMELRAFPVNLDLRTLILSATLCKLAQAAILIHVAKVHRDYAPTREWGAGAFLAAMGLSLIGLRGFIPAWLLFSLTDGLLFSGHMVFDFGIIRAAGFKPPWRFGTVVCIVSFGAFFWVCLIDPNYHARIILFNATLLFFDALVVAACLAHSGRTFRVTLRVIAVLHAAQIISGCWRAIGAFTLDAGSVWAPIPEYFIASPVFALAITAALVLLTSQKLQAELNEQARHDPLTRAFNRRTMDSIIAGEWPRAARHHYPVACLMLDIDNFKAFNDSHGHRTGDAVLVAVSATARALIRSEDAWCRYGGEEFVVFLPHANKEQARVVAQRVLEGIAAQRIDSRDGPLGVTVSIGVAAGMPSAMTWLELVENADRALYRAKANGRNRIETEPEETHPIPDEIPQGLVRLAWNQGYECGHPAIDQQHRQLFETANRLLSAITSDHPREECRELITMWINDVVKHFHDEIALLHATGYPDADEHRRTHEDLAAKASGLADRYDRQELTLGHLISFLALDLVSEHMSKEGHKLSSFFGGRTRGAE